ncbi:MAG: Rrf2 family transcriptional regulator [Anaerolineae bacterium]|nr:Rrf2 family transcriptional regulator [Anaerolineae bacterium]
MKLSTKTRYGTRAMLELALAHERGTPLNAREIAQHQNVSVKYLEHLLAALQASGLLHSMRGPQGGYTLARPPEEITLRQIYDALEGSQALVECTRDPQLCEKADLCVTREIWAEMFAACMAVLERTTLADLVQRLKEKQGTLADMYYI